LRKIITQQKELSDALVRAKNDSITRLYSPEIKPIPPVTMNRGETKTLKHGIFWAFFDKDEITIRVEVPAGSGLKAATPFVAKTDKDDFSYDLTAGDVPGDYLVKLIPTVGRPMTVKVTVK